MNAFMQWIYELDLSVFSAVFSIGNEVLDTIMEVITTLGDGWVMPVFAVILLIFKKTRKAGVMMLGALVVMLVLNNWTLKPLIARIRPCYVFDLDAILGNEQAFVDGGKVDMFNNIVARVKENIAAFPELAARWVAEYEFPNVVHMPTSWSFPSGHTSSSFAFATAVAANNKKWGIAAFVLAALIGFSRIYLGVHYFTDVFAGAVLGVVYGLIGVLVIGAVIKLLKKKDWKIAKFF